MNDRLATCLLIIFHFLHGQIPAAHEAVLCSSYLIILQHLVPLVTFVNVLGLRFIGVGHSLIAGRCLYLFLPLLRANHSLTESKSPPYRI